MRTRNQAKRNGESTSGAGCSREQEGRTMAKAGSRRGRSSLSAVSEEAVGRLLKRVSTRKTGCRGRSRSESQYTSWEARDNKTELKGDGKSEEDEDMSESTSLDRFGCDSDGTTPVEEKHKTFRSDEVDWEEGSIPLSECGVKDCHELGKEITVEFSESPSSTQRRPSRRVSIEDKELAELVHKVHLLCLIARGRLTDHACNDTLLQASILSLLPSNLLKITEVSRLTSTMLGPLVNWFHKSFRIRSQIVDRGCFKLNLQFALESREGTAEEVAALSVALFRSLKLTTRFVSNLDVASLKPDFDVLGNSSYDTTHLETKIPCPVTVNSSSIQIRAPDPVPSSDAQDEAMSPKTSSNSKSEDSSKRKGDIEFELQLAIALSATATTSNDNKAGHNMEELHDALSPFSSPIKKMRKAKGTESSFSGCVNSGAVWSRKSGPPLYWAEVYCSGESLNGKWVHIDAANGFIDGEEKVEPAAAACRRPLRYAVAFAGSGAKDVTRRYCKQWYRIASLRINSQWWDTVLAPLKVLESGATGEMVPLESLWDSISVVDNGTFEVHPLQSQELKTHEESSSLGYSSNVKSNNLEVSKQIGITNAYEGPHRNPNQCSRVALEDMDLETRALTEPLPTNQMAYRNHHLYAIERWLTKYQTLYPKGPVVGYCSGLPVYPRSCVQMVQSKQKWLREGLQVREDEVPAKVIKRSKVARKVEFSESFAEEEESIELFGRWQLEPLKLPHAVNGIVPKNEYGRVDVWSEKCLPPGTVHLRLPRLVPVAKRLGVDFAVATVGFEFRNGRSHPIYEGIVVCTEFRDAIMEAYAEEEERREAEERQKREANALSRWFQLLSSMATRHRLESSYRATSSSSQPTDRSCEHNGGLEGHVNDAKFAISTAQNDHEHVYPLENQSLDEEGSLCTRRCPCGFSIQVELL
ncbi:hypothetical protein HPP92_024778 [Vanilla planifolia]|uniref:DNA repair protein RAD4 n=1 Tax=Vanilla planifolia TaxID=51239 RepID=A0A835UDK9_VANPL|nr:hypothetical protein HPP92_024778 [Vanilla planifolia]